MTNNMTEIEKRIWEKIAPQRVARARYYDVHKYCPKCGHEHCTTTLAAIRINGNPDDMNSYTDTNTAWCGKCGDVHTVHDRISEATKI
jgi:transcription elongation factor Elf1